MRKSDPFATKYVRFSPVRIRNSLEKLLLVGLGIGNITVSRKHCGPGFFIPVLDRVCIHEKMGKIVVNADIHGFAALNKAVEEGGNLCTGLSDVEQPVLLAKTEWSDCC